MLSKIERLFFRYNIELFFLLLFLYLPSISGVLDADLDGGNIPFNGRIAFVILFSSIVLPILYFVLLKSLFVTVCLLGLSIITSLGFLLSQINQGNILDIIPTILALICLNAIVYRSYLNTKYEKEK